MVKSILYAAGEAQPFASTGGLGDVMGALPATIRRNHPDCDVRAVMPLYSKISDKFRSKMTFLRWITVNLGWRTIYCGIFMLEHEGVKWYFIDNEHYFNRQSLYGDFDDGEKFAYFSLCVLEMMRALDFYPDILHCNDWQTALAVILLKQRYEKISEYSKVRAVFTIHNIQYQGVFGMDNLGDLFSLSVNDKGIVDYNGALNLTKGAVVCADKVTTVSPQYAKEIQTPEYSYGLHYITQMYSYKITGIVNGIDYDAWNPKTDKSLPANYSPRGLKNKSVCKEELQKRLGIEVRPDVPVISMITRLVEPKGVDLVRCVIDEIMKDDVQFVLLGTGDYDYEQFFGSLNSVYGNKYRAIINFDRDLSRLIYAGSDMFLMPSRSEACGLAQMIASRYGTVPIVHETGGLFDTIKPYKNGGNGFTFANYNAHDMLYVIREAERLYYDKESWKRLQIKAMNTDFTWDKSAESYYTLYDSIGY